MSNKQPIVSDICEEIRTRRRNGESYESLNDNYTMNIDEILNHTFGNCECENNVEQLQSRNDEPWREKYLIQKLYREDEKRFTEMAETLDCHSETAKKYVDKFDVSPIDSSDRTSSPRVNKLMRLGKEGDADIMDEP
jgi:hypothetical protein